MKFIGRNGGTQIKMTPGNKLVFKANFVIMFSPHEQPQKEEKLKE